ncbi:MAG: hypothetical protein KC620_02925 [Myxococcales bacterium]|nr:hypothetical protein [Myxococcales bacterium]
MRRSMLALALALAPGCLPDGGSDDESRVIIEDVDGDVGATIDAESAEDMGPPIWDAAPMIDAALPPPSSDGIDVVEVEDVEFTRGRTDFLEVELPDDVVSLTIIAEGEPTVLFCINHLEGPDGTILVAQDPPGVTLSPFDQQISPCPGAFKSPNRSATTTTGIGAVLAPNNPGVAVGPGRWRYRASAIGAFGPVTTRARFKLLIKRADPAPTVGTLDLHLHFTGARGWTAANAPTDPDFQRALARMEGFYQRIGITLGEKTYDDIPAEYRAVDSGPEGPGADADNSSLHHMFQLSAYDTGVSLFFVDRIGEPMFGGAIGGIAGGTPGPSLQAGTVRSGVAVATQLDPNPDSIGHIMGHETGHFLGLYHTQEFIGGITDQIDDTAPGQGGSDNLMFPTVTSAPARLTDGQGFVLHRSPCITPVAEEAP